MATTIGYPTGKQIENPNQSSDRENALQALLDHFEAIQKQHTQIRKLGTLSSLFNYD